VRSNRKSEGNCVGMSSGRDIRTLPLSQESIQALLSSGFTSVGDLRGVLPLDLRKETGLSVEEAHAALLCIKAVEGMCPQPAKNLLKRVLTDPADLDAHVSPPPHAQTEADQDDDGSTSSSSLASLFYPSVAEPVTMRALLSKVGKTDSIITFCRSVDKLMGGGVPLGAITEFVGAPGVGKTQLAMQLALDAQIPALFSGAEGSAIYIDTEGSFWPQRAFCMAQRLSAHLQKIANIKPKGLKIREGLSAEEARAEHARAEASLLQQRQAVARSMTPERLLQGIQVVRVHSQTELLATINSLPAFVGRHNAASIAATATAAAASGGAGGGGGGERGKVNIGPVRVVVIDSIAFHFRHDISDTKARARLLAAQANKLHELACKEVLAVVTTNHVTTRVLVGGSTASGSGMHHDVQCQVSVHGTSGTGTPVAAAEAAVISRYDASSTLVPALGEVWTQAISNRVFLHWQSAANVAAHTHASGALVQEPSAQGNSENSRVPQRAATVTKSASMPVGTAFYRVCEDGVRDIVGPRGTGSSKSAHVPVPGSAPPVAAQVTSEDASKRPRYV